MLYVFLKSAYIKVRSEELPQSSFAIVQGGVKMTFPGISVKITCAAALEIHVFRAQQWCHGLVTQSAAVVSINILILFFCGLCF